jgi:hypothetical protein
MGFTMTSHLLRLVALLLGTAGELIAQQPSTQPQCYHLTVGPWQPPLGPDPSYHRIPSVVRLDTLAWDSTARVLEPAIAYPDRKQFPRTPRWELRGDTVRLVWSNGFTPTIVTLVRQGTGLEGEAVAESDARPSTIPRARVVAEPLGCESSGLRAAP